MNGCPACGCYDCECTPGDYTGPSCGYAFYGPPALCTCGHCAVDEAEMEAAQKELDAQIETGNQAPQRSERLNSERSAEKDLIKLDPPAAVSTEPLPNRRCEARTEEGPGGRIVACALETGHSGPHVSIDGDTTWKPPIRTYSFPTRCQRCNGVIPANAVHTCQRGPQVGSVSVSAGEASTDTAQERSAKALDTHDFSLSDHERDTP